MPLQVVRSYPHVLSTMMNSRASVAWSESQDQGRRNDTGLLSGLHVFDLSRLIVERSNSRLQERLRRRHLRHT
jgi:hypothetical protein